jgi:hypothetical protein
MARRRVDKSTTGEGGQSIEEMASVEGSVEWGDMGAVESTVQSSSSAHESTMASEGSGFRSASRT